MPSCTQCETSRIQCRYSESNKRGIPTGYLGLLEQRLNETEAALFGALSELRGLGSSKPLQRDANPSKMTRMEEWKEYPLQGEGGLERWFQLLGTNQGVLTNVLFQLFEIRILLQNRNIALNCAC